MSRHKIQFATVGTIVPDRDERVIKDQTITTVNLPCGIVPGEIKFIVGTESRRAEDKELRMIGLPNGKIVRGHQIEVKCVIGNAKYYNNIDVDLLDNGGSVNDDCIPDRNEDFRRVDVAIKKIERTFRREIGGKLPAAILRKLKKAYQKTLDRIPLVERLTERQKAALEKAEQAATIYPGNRVALIDGRSGQSINCVVRKVNRTSYMVLKEGEVDKSKIFRVPQNRVKKLLDLEVSKKRAA
jgi:hypothetical protein